MFPVTTLCQVLGVSTSGYYAWCRRPESPRRQQDRRLKVLIRTSFDASKQSYGSPRIHRDLLEEHDEHVSRKRVIRLMQEEGVKARQRKRFVCTTDSGHDLPVAANLLNREFTAEAPNQRWVGDTTECKIGESGKLYLAAILDLFSRFVVGWAVSAVNDRHLTLAALTMALNAGVRDGLLHHSDRGSTYASEDYQDRLAAHGITCSMSRTGDCYDNAVMEAFFSTLKTELADTFASHGQAKRELFDYIEAFYNTRRRHSTLDYVSPAEFERRFRSGRGEEHCA
jgi:transposase InsO family protein